MLSAARELARLYVAARLFVNFFQPSFKLIEKCRDGALVRKRYDTPAIRCQRLPADLRTSEPVRSELTALQYRLDPVAWEDGTPRPPGATLTCKYALVAIAQASI